MTIDLYCWRCRVVVPMLDEREWRQIQPLLGQARQDVKRYRRQHNVSLSEAAEKAFGLSALRKYRELTGVHETNFNAIWHHRHSLYGPPCAECGKPLRTPKAELCAYCGAKRQKLPFQLRLQSILTQSLAAFGVRLRR